MFYGIAVPPVTAVDVSELVVEGRKSGVTIRPIHDPKLHAKILGWDDDSLLITSLNWLSADPPDRQPQKEIGVFVRAPRAAKWVIEHFYHSRRE